VPYEPSRDRTRPTSTALWAEGRVPETLPDAVHSSALVEANRHRALFRLKTVGRFLVEPEQPTIVERAAGATVQDLECFLRGPVAALRLCLAGHFALRGAAVEIDGRALAVCGISTGASTLAAALALEGHSVLADGVVCIDGNPPTVVLVPEADPPRLTLWPDVAEAFGLDTSDGELVRPSLSSRAFALGPPPPSRPVPLGALVSLGVADRRDVPVTPEPLSGFAAVATLLKAFWHPHLTEDLGMAKQQFQWAATIAGGTPTVLLPPGRDDIGASCRLLVKAALEVVG
jgi:hypothetical protein